MSTTEPLAPPSPRDDASLRLTALAVRLFERMKQAIREAGDELGLSTAQLDVLRRLYTNGPTPMSRLAGMLHCEASNLTGLVDKLEQRGLVERQADPEDRRVRRLALTHEGRRVSNQAWFAVTARCPFQPMSPEDKGVLEALLLTALGDDEPDGP